MSVTFSECPRGKNDAGHAFFPNETLLEVRLGINRFHFNNFKFFVLSFQSAFHLSLAVLVRYRSPVIYLALDGVYHPI